MKKLIMLIVLLLTLPSICMADCANEYDEEDNIIGLMITYYVADSPNKEICVQWLDNGLPAFAPNVDIRQGPYCRTTDENGITFFSYRYRKSLDCVQAIADIELKILP